MSTQPEIQPETTQPIIPRTTNDSPVYDALTHRWSIPTSNPISNFRTMEGLTQEELAKLAGVSRHFILRAEQGVYNEVPNSILDVIVGRGYSSHWTRDSYYLFQSQTRFNNFGHLVPHYFTSERREQQEEDLDRLRSRISSKKYRDRQKEVHSVPRREGATGRTPVGNFEEYHPFIKWRKASGINSTVKIATLFCVHPTTLQNFEKKSLERDVPSQLLDALQESGYSIDELLNLSRLYRNYREVKWS